jgi:hypothetical protein
MVKEEIIKRLHEIKAPGDVAAGQVYKGTDYDGARYDTGWWFRPFNSHPLWLGLSKASAFEIIDQIKDERNNAD